MTFTITITAMHFYTFGLFSFIAVLLYIYSKDDGDDRLTHMRHNIEMEKEWFKMLSERNKNVIR
jgi:hypothetical protein